MGKVGSNARPQVIIAKEASSIFWVDPEQVSKAMHHLGISSHHIAATTICLDSKWRLYFRGYQLPKAIDRLLHGKQLYNRGSASIITIGTRFRGKQLGLDKLNRILVHELEHAAQFDRRDLKLLAEPLIYLLTVGAAIAIYVLTNSMNSIILRLSTLLVGVAMVYRLVYLLAPHEWQARSVARQVTTDAIKKR